MRGPRAKVSFPVEHRPGGYEGWKDETPFRRPNLRALLIIFGAIMFGCAMIGALTAFLITGRGGEVEELSTPPHLVELLVDKTELTPEVTDEPEEIREGPEATVELTEDPETTEEPTTGRVLVISTTEPRAVLESLPTYTLYPTYTQPPTWTPAPPVVIREPGSQVVMTSRPRVIEIPGQRVVVTVPPVIIREQQTVIVIVSLTPSATATATHIPTNTATATATATHTPAPPTATPTPLATATAAASTETPTLAPEETPELHGDA